VQDGQHCAFVRAVQMLEFLDRFVVLQQEVREEDAESRDSHGQTETHMNDLPADWLQRLR